MPAAMQTGEQAMVTEEPGAGEADRRQSEPDKAELERELEKGLKDTFPASDPVSVTRAARNEPVLRLDENERPRVVDQDTVDEDAEGTDIEKAQEIGYASEAGNR